MSERMNVLIIITDQQRADHLSCMGNIILNTSNIDSIANEGMRFTNYFCASPICMPNRASFFTGTFPSVHGTRSNGINLNPKTPILSEILRKQGYYTATVGKTHFNFFSNPSGRKVNSLENIIGWVHGDLKSSEFPSPWYGFEDVRMTAGHGDIMGGHYSEWVTEKGFDLHSYLLEKTPLALNDYYYETKMPEELFPTTYITNNTIDILESHLEGKNADRPFFLHCSYPDPHHPVCPPGKYKDLYKPEEIRLPSNFNDVENLLDHEFLGQHIRNARFRQLLPQKVSEEEVKIFTALTYGSIALIDKGVGEILRTLEKTGLASNTMVIFMSDHGDLCGDHGLILKGPAHYRSVINMPLIWKIPGLPKNQISESLVSTIDLPKTILTLLGIREKTHPKTMQGKDITPILKNPSEKIREQLLIEHDEEISKDKVMRLRTLVTESHRLTLYNGYDKIGDIFDYTNDPNEVNNLWIKKIDLKNELLEKLLREIINLQPRVPKRKAYN
jgi:arylsulfatase A-like enzyme